MSKVQDLGPRLVTLKTNDKGVTMKLQNVRLVFVKLDQPNTGFVAKDSKGEPIDGTYEATALIPAKNFQPIFNQFKTEIEKALKINSRLKDGPSRLNALKTALAIGKEFGLFKKGDEQKNKEGKVYDGLQGHYTFKVKSKAVKGADGSFKPRVEFKVVDKNNNPIPAHSIRDEVYSGIWADVVFTLSPYEYMKKQSVTVYLGGVMKLADDAKLGGSDPFGAARSDIEDANDFDVSSDFEDAPAPAKKAGKGGKKSADF